jgi:endonuclease/exonuclease/phosphatase family metal-dependent hydrolase
MSIKTFDAVNTNFFDNYFYLDGISNHAGYKKYEPVQIQDNQYTLKEAAPQSCNFLATLLKIASYCIVIIPVIMLIGKIIFRLQNDFTIQDLDPRSSTISQPQADPIHLTTQVDQQQQQQQTNPITTQVDQQQQQQQTNSITTQVDQQKEQQQLAGNSFTVGTYNILLPQTLPKSVYSTPVGYNTDERGDLYENSKFRTNIIINNLNNANLDIICLQEVTADMGNAIATSPKLQAKYSFTWEMHPQLQPPYQHGVAIGFRKDRFERSSNVEDIISLNKRVHLIMNLKDKTTQKIVRIASCHLLDMRDRLNYNGEHTQHVVNTTISGSPADYTIIAGDMNADASGLNDELGISLAFKPLIDKEFKADENRESSEFTKAEYGNGPIISKDRRIDWIWAKGATPVHLPLSSFDNRGSDHRLVAVTI